MIPVLYEPGEREFLNLGLGRLNEAKGTVAEELNGLYELEMTYPIDGIRYDEINPEYIVVAKPNLDFDPQAFRIYDIKKGLDGMAYIKAQHISYDLVTTPVSEFNSGNVESALAKYTPQKALEVLESHIFGETPFTFETDMPNTIQQTFQNNYPNSVRELLGSNSLNKTILSLYGGDFEFDNFVVRLKQFRGRKDGIHIRYGYNLTDVDSTVNSEELYTHIYPYWYVEDDGLMDLPEKIIETGVKAPIKKIRVLDLTSQFDGKRSMPTSDELRSKASNYIKTNSIGRIKDSLRVSFATLDYNGEFWNVSKLEEVGLGDLITVEYPKIGVFSTARCIKTVFNFVDEKYESVEIGDPISTLSEVLYNRSLNKLNPNNAKTDPGGNVTNKIIATDETGKQYYMVPVIKNGTLTWEKQEQGGT